MSIDRPSGDGETNFPISTELKQDSVNTLSVTTVDAFGLVSLPAIRQAVEGPAFPATVESVTALSVSPSPAPAVALNGSLPFTCEATFSDASTADVTEFVTWNEFGNGEVITDGGLYVNTAPGSANIRALVAGKSSNAVSVADIP